MSTPRRASAWRGNSTCRQKSPIRFGGCRDPVIDGANNRSGRASVFQCANQTPGIGDGPVDEARQEGALVNIVEPVASLLVQDVASHAGIPLRLDRILTPMAHQLPHIFEQRAAFLQTRSIGPGGSILSRLFRNACPHGLEVLLRQIFPVSPRLACSAETARRAPQRFRSPTLPMRLTGRPRRLSCLQSVFRTIPRKTRASPAQHHVHMGRRSVWLFIIVHHCSGPASWAGSAQTKHGTAPGFERILLIGTAEVMRLSQTPRD